MPTSDHIYSPKKSPKPCKQRYVRTAAADLRSSLSRCRIVRARNGAETAPSSYLLTRQLQNMITKTFTITPEHLLLLRRLHFEWDGSAFAGAPCVDIKRPYGNSDPLGYDVPLILGLIWPEDQDQPREIYEQCKQLHEDMDKVLAIFVSTGQCAPGEYEQVDYDDTRWRLKGGDHEIQP